MVFRIVHIHKIRRGVTNIMTDLYKKIVAITLQWLCTAFVSLLFLHIAHVRESAAGEMLSPQPMIPPDAADSMTTKELSKIGEILIFGKVGGSKENGLGKGSCPLCHYFHPRKALPLDRAPSLYGIGKTAELRIKDSRYLHPDTVQAESFPGSGRATTAGEYIAESHICPSCFVVPGFGAKGTNDRESLGPKINDPPISLTIDELIAIDTWLYVNGGETPPPPKVIRAAYEKFIPEAERLKK